MPGPVHQRSTGDISRANHQIDIARGSDQARQVVDVVRAVSVHLTDEIGTLLERVPHAVDVRAPEPLLARPVDPVHAAFVLTTQS
jgi:hypothetical protein